MAGRSAATSRRSSRTDRSARQIALASTSHGRRPHGTTRLVELALAPKLSALIVVHQDVVANPVSYGPGVGIALTGRLGD